MTQSADTARQANQLVAGAAGAAERGGAVVGRVVESMNSISESSKKIADIIGVIDGIAFQTNILALNAAVEAARAGEQGRGFAVVAGEVRSLAQRSAEAAKEIKGLITASVERVETGTALVDRAGTTMDEIVKAIQRVTDIVAEISAASSEQSSGVSQVGQAVAQMDQATQQNAALVEESAAAAQSLKDAGAKVDRIDVLSDGTLRVVDYKSRRTPDVRQALQLPVYSLVALESLRAHGDRPYALAEALYLSFEGDRPVVSLRQRNKPIDELLEDAQERMLVALDRIAQGEFPPRPAKRSLCGPCPYRTVCRLELVEAAAPETAAEIADE